MSLTTLLDTACLPLVPSFGNAISRAATEFEPSLGVVLVFCVWVSWCGRRNLNPHGMSSFVCVCAPLDHHHTERTTTDDGPIYDARTSLPTHNSSCPAPDRWGRNPVATPLPKSLTIAMLTRRQATERAKKTVSRVSSLFSRLPICTVSSSLSIVSVHSQSRCHCGSRLFPRNSHISISQCPSEEIF